jgi:3-methyladenine DNA glycosylase AlkD
MLFSRFISLLVVFSIVCASGLAQFPLKKSEPEKEKPPSELEKNAIELLEQVIGETAALKLPENRALIYAMTGDALWAKDEKRARGLFRAAGGEILQVVNTKTEKSDSRSSEIDRPDVFNRRQAEILNLRQMVLRALAERDAEMALEILQSTRAPEVAAEMQTYVAPVAAANSAQKQESPPSAPRNFRVEQEIRLEQALIAKAAEQDPAKAAQKIRANLEKGFSMEIIRALQRIYKKDAELASKLFDETIQKLLAADLSKSQANMNFAVSLLILNAFPPKENPNVKSRSSLAMDEKSARDIANKIADTFMKAANLSQLSALNNALPVLQKLVPERAAQLKQKQAALKKQAPQNTRVFEPPASLNDPNAAPEKIIADATKAQPQMRGLLYRQAVSRGISGDAEKIRSLLQSQPDSKERDDAIAALDSTLAMRQLHAGKADEARKIIDRMPFGAAKAEQLVQLAVASYRLNTKESRENAVRLMSEAREMVKDFPEDKDETDGLLKVIAGFAVIEPERAFTMLAPVIEQANEVVNAQAVLARYNKQTQDFRDGEMVMSNNFSSLNAKVFRYGKELKLLAQNDFTRTRGLIDQFRRDDVRLFVRLFVAQSMLKDKIGLEGGMTIFRN